MRRLTVGALVVVLALLGLVGHTAWSIGAYSSQSTLLSADAAIVLGAAAWGDEPSPVFRERINHAIELYRQGYVRKLIFTGASGQPGEPPESLVARQYALQCGVPEGDILVEVSSHIT
ncbi:MAG: YdcF family protein, partial [Anaerolineae bacterium]|nr:YdcF family protein [Anaerolineae bacterium]